MRKAAFELVNDLACGNATTFALPPGITGQRPSTVAVPVPTKPSLS